MYKIFYRPAEPDSAAADFIPYYEEENKTFSLFYLFDHRRPEKYGEGVTWYLTQTEDFTHFTDKGEMIARGKSDEPDLFVFTGSVLYAFEKYHMFYTGHNPHITTYGYQNECIMHAESDDLLHWTKKPKDTFLAPDGYDRCDFRDPFVYRDGENGDFLMLLCARPVKGNCLRKGQTIRMRSHDLKSWSFDRILYAPEAYHTHECPDFFRMGDYYYLIFSEYSDRSVTCYRMSKSPNGPWYKPENDTFDGRAYYAAKTAFDGKNRYLFGWIPTRMGAKDNGNWMWGGNLAVHKLLQNPDGTLSVSLPESISGILRAPVSCPTSLILDAECKCKVENLTKNAPDHYCLSFTAIPEKECDTFGVLLHRNGEADTSYAFAIDLMHGTLSVNRFPCFPQNEFLTYQLCRPVKKAAAYRVKLLTDDDVSVLYVNDDVALSVRFCAKDGKQLALFAQEGKVRIVNISLYQ